MGRRGTGRASTRPATSLPAALQPRAPLTRAGEGAPGQGAGDVCAPLSLPLDGSRGAAPPLRRVACTPRRGRGALGCRSPAPGTGRTRLSAVRLPAPRRVHARPQSRWERSPSRSAGASSPGAGELCAPLSADAQGAAPTPRTALAQVPGSLDAGGRTEPGRTGCTRREKSASRSRGSPRSPEVPGPGPLPHLPDAA